ncbi:chondroitin AC/alginate lyase [Marasmius fiardii PR-910]|nr:chondroitin AC/alginate lyase [Marasmius fiardii PR-910]
MIAHQTLLAATLLLLCQHVKAETSYISDFVDPTFILAKDFPFHTYQAEVSIVKWARQFSLRGPWSVMDKPVAPPSGDKHDYLSWSPYSWPDCSSVGNTSILTDEQVWTTCPYKLRDGQFNPDGRLINDVGHFDDLSNAVLYSSIAYVITGGNSNSFSRNAVRFIKRWFLDSDTKMNPSLTYAQILRGPDGQVGRHTGVLDMKGFVRIATAIEIFRKSNNTDWTPKIDSGMVDWVKNYTSWIETDPTALKEAAALNNHGTFYHVQLAALKLIVNDREGAKQVIENYYNSQFLTQIEENGEQVSSFVFFLLEAARTRPYHYHTYNIAAIISLARIAQYIDPEYNVWNRTSAKGGSLKKAMDFTLSLDPAISNETSAVIELYPYVTAIGAVFGDPDGRYRKWLQDAHPDYATDPHFLWNQPFVGGPTATSAADRARMTRRISSGDLGLKVTRGNWCMLGLLAVGYFAAGVQ